MQLRGAEGMNTCAFLNEKKVFNMKMRWHYVFYDTDSCHTLVSAMMLLNNNLHVQVGPG